MAPALRRPGTHGRGGNASGASLPGGASALGLVNVALAEYRRLFLVASSTQVGDGVAAGAMSTGRLAPG